LAGMHFTYGIWTFIRIFLDTQKKRNVHTEKKCIKNSEWI
jgi:hypothetical protein